MRSVRVLLPPEVSVPVSAVRTEGVLDLQVDPRTGALEWRGEAMELSAGTEEEKKKDDAPRRFKSKPMELHLHQPGELFMQQDLSIEVCVEVPDELLSGTQVRMFTATGEPDATGNRRVLQTRTVITTHCRVILHDAFLKRQISPRKPCPSTRSCPMRIGCPTSEQRWWISGSRSTVTPLSARTAASDDWNTSSSPRGETGPTRSNCGSTLTDAAIRPSASPGTGGRPLHKQV